MEGKEQSSPVDAAVELPNGQEIDGVDQLKRYLRDEHGEPFGRALVHHMLTYPLGRSFDFSDRQQVESIHRRFAASEYRLKELVLAIVNSETFRA